MPNAPHRPLVAGVAAFLAFQTIASLAAQTPPVIATEIAADVQGVSAAQAGLFTGIVFAFSILASLATGGLIRRFGALRASQIALCLSATAYAMLALGAPAALLCAAVMLGLSYGPITPAGSHALAMVAPERSRAAIFSAKQAGVPLGVALAGLIAPLSASSGGGSPIGSGDRGW